MEEHPGASGCPGGTPSGLCSDIDALVQRHRRELHQCLERWFMQQTRDLSQILPGDRTQTPHHWQTELVRAPAESRASTQTRLNATSESVDAADECLRALAQAHSPAGSAALPEEPPGFEGKLAATMPALGYRARSPSAGPCPWPRPFGSPPPLLGVGSAWGPGTLRFDPRPPETPPPRSCMRSPSAPRKAIRGGTGAGAGAVSLPGTVPRGGNAGSEDGVTPSSEASARYAAATSSEAERGRKLADKRGFTVRSLEDTYEREDMSPRSFDCTTPLTAKCASPPALQQLSSVMHFDGSPQEEANENGTQDGSSASGAAAKPAEASQDGAQGPKPSYVPIRFSRNLGEKDKTPQHRRWQHLTRGKKGMSRYRNLTPLAKRKMERMLENQSDLERLTRSYAYELAEAAAIILNVVLIAYDIERRASWVAAGSSMPVVRGEAFLNVLGDLFCLLFATDLVLRFLANGWEFFISRECFWNIFDVVVVLTTVLETGARWHQYATASMTEVRVFAGKFTAIRIVRILRIIRSTRAIRASPVVRELSIMVYSLTGAIRPFLWSVVLLSAVLLIFAVFFVDGAIAFSVKSNLEGQGDTTPEMSRFFSTLPLATTSLYMAMTGGVDWEEIWQALAPLPPEYRAVFLTFITFGILALLNVITAVFVETAMQRSQNDQELKVQTEVEKKVDFIQKMQRIFEELDTNSSGTLTLEEFEKQMQDENVLTFMSTLELDIDQVRTLLTLLDRDQNGEVDIDEFITGCIRLKGGAKSLDMAILQYQVEWMLHNIASLHQLLVVRFDLVPNARELSATSFYRALSSLSAPAAPI